MNELPVFYSIQDLKDYYNRTRQGYWFSEGTMKFFKTRLTSNFRQLDDTSYLFVTTECPPEGVRKASVRLCVVEPNVDKFCGYGLRIETVEGFNSMSLSQAVKVMKEYANG